MENPFSENGRLFRQYVLHEKFPTKEVMDQLDRITEELNAELEKIESHGGLSPGQVLRGMAEKILTVTNEIPSIAQQIETAIQQGKSGDVLNILRKIRKNYKQNT